jgi:membrane protein DedA with SNARE-associated domain
MEYEFLQGQPFWIAYLALFGIVFARTQATYWLGRGLGRGVRSTRRGRRLGPRLDRAERLINRFGPPVITVSYATVGFQTAAHLMAGAMRMGFIRYLLAMIPGCALWAALYGLGGLAVLAAVAEAFTHMPLLTALLVTAAVVAGAVLITRRVRRVRAEPEQSEDAPAAPLSG